MELYKSAAPCVRNLVRKACVKDLAPKIREQRLDESGVDGIRYSAFRICSPHLLNRAES